jgi:hypothetical protein
VMRDGGKTTVITIFWSLSIKSQLLGAGAGLVISSTHYRVFNCTPCPSTLAIVLIP